MKINKDLDFLKLQCKKLKMCRSNRKIYFKNIRQDMGSDPFLDWHNRTLSVVMTYDSSTVGCNTGSVYEALPNLSQQEGTFE